jgi:hypothetical protein
MARSIQRYNVDVKLDEEMAVLASASGTSRSEQMNLALKAALADMPGVISRLLHVESEWGRRRLTSFMVDPTLTEGLNEASQKLDLSRDAIVKLAMRSYILSKQTQSQ